MARFHLTVGLVLATFSTGAIAATKCVWIDGTSSCASAYSLYRVNWSSDCNVTNNGTSKSISVSGLGACSNQEPGTTSPGISDELSRAVSQDENIHCWCKMIKPAISKWVFAETISTTSVRSCSSECAEACGLAMQFTAAFRSAIFQNLDD